MTVQIPVDQLTRTWIFHITALDNLSNILEAGCVYAKNHLPLTPCSIANEEIQEKRNRKQVMLPPGGVIHDYVPFYFAPRSPMLYVNHNGYISNAKPQRDIIHLVTTAQIIAEACLPFVFYDRHAMKAVAQAYNHLQHLDKIDWELFFEPPPGGGKYATHWAERHDERNPKWTGRKEIRQAEFLVHHQLPWEHIRGIGVIDEAKKTQVTNILHHFGYGTKIKVKRDWYY